MECAGGAVDAEGGNTVRRFTTEAQRHREKQNQQIQKTYGNYKEIIKRFSLSLCASVVKGFEMTEAEVKKHLEAAEKSPKQVAAAVSGLPDKTLRYKPAPDKWCIQEILGHLADVEILYAYRLRQMLADKKPVIAPVDVDDWARNLGYMETHPAELIALYGLNRHANVQLLRRLKPGGLEKSAFHPELKKDVTVAEYVEKLGTHGANHLERIERLKKEGR
jgi:hypothetical protein